MIGTTATNVRLYKALVMSVLMYAAETWTLLTADLRTLEAFQMPATDVSYPLDRPHQQRDCLVTYRSHVSWRANCESPHRNVWPYCQTE